MKITNSTNTQNLVSIKQESQDLLQGSVSKLAPKQVDNVTDVNFKGTRENHRISFQYNKDLGRNVAHVIDNATGKTVKLLPSETQIDHMIRLKRLLGLHVDVEA